MTPTDPSPADVVARLREAVHDGEAYAGTLPAKEAVKLRPKDWHAITGEARRAASLITSLQARAEKAERERDDLAAMIRELLAIHQAHHNHPSHGAARRLLAALANKETENG